MRVVLIFLFLFLSETSQGLTFNVRTAHTQMLTKVVGYAKEAGITGGEGGEVVYIQNLNDFGPGSMRSALEHPDTRIVLFENGVDGTIQLSEDLEIESNKTIWGRHRDGTGADIFITPVGTQSFREDVFKVTGSDGNVIIANLKGDAPGPNDLAPTWLTIRGTGGPVWAHHISLDGGCGPLGSECSDMDGAADIQDKMVTIDHWLVENWDNVSIVRDGANATFHRSLYRNNNGRMPRPSGSGSRAHAFLLWIDAYRGHGIEAVDDGEVRVENVIFSSGPDMDDDALRGNWAGIDNVFEGLAVATPQQSGIFVPSYAYTLDPLDTPEQILTLKNYLEINAGWQPFSEFAIPEPSTLVLFIGFIVLLMIWCVLYHGRRRGR